jgi:hypothetical protein
MGPMRTPNPPPMSEGSTAQPEPNQRYTLADPAFTPPQSDYAGIVAMAEEVATHPNFHLLDWVTFIDEPGNYGAYIDHSRYGLGVHPNAAGQQVLANMELQALQRDCP